MKRYFYIDTENVQNYEFLKNWDLTFDDTVIFFISPNSRNIKFAELKPFLNTYTNFIFEEAIVGEKNAMDYQIVINLAFNINKNLDDIHYIVSDDCGFKTSMEYINKSFDKRIVYMIKPNIDTHLWNLVKTKNLSDYHNAVVKTYGESTKIQVYLTYKDAWNTIKEMISLEDKTIDKIILESNNLVKYRGALIKYFGQVKGNELYWKTKERFLKTLNKRKNDNVKIDNI